MNVKLKKFQGITYNYSQPISDNVAEAVAGFKAETGLKSMVTIWKHWTALLKKFIRRFAK